MRLRRRFLTLRGFGFFIAGNGAKRHFNDDILAIAAGHIVLITALTVFGQYVFIIAKV